MKSTPYVKLEYEEAISGKRELLSSQADILKILKLIQNYKTLRKKELIKKNKLKLLLNKLEKHIKNTLKDLPETEEIPEIESEPEIREISKKKTINAELKNIQDKLAELEEQ